MNGYAVHLAVIKLMTYNYLLHKIIMFTDLLEFSLNGSEIQWIQRIQGI